MILSSINFSKEWNRLASKLFFSKILEVNSLILEPSLFKNEKRTPGIPFETL